MRFGYARGFAPAQRQQHEGSRAHDQANELRGREAGQRSQSKQIAARVVAQKLDGKANYGIEQCVEKDHLTVEAPVFVKPKQKKEDQQHREGFIQLGRMQTNIKRHSGNFMTQLGKLHAPGKRSRFTPATTRSETSLPAKKVSNGDSGSAGVSGLPPRELVTPHQEVAGENRADQSSIKNSTRTEKVERDSLQGMVAIFRFREEH